LRQGGIVSGLKDGQPQQVLQRHPAPRGEEHALLASPRRDAITTIVLIVLTIALFLLMADRAILHEVQKVDDTYLRTMVGVRNAPFTAVAKLLDVLGLIYITLPVRIAIAGYLALRRRWWHLAAFVGAIVLSEALIGILKGVYARPRPLGSLVATSGASFPSGHAVAASVTVVAAVIALVPSGRRYAWGTAALAFSILMGLSRGYLGAHWLSDALAGVLLGGSSALVAAWAVQLVRNRRSHTQVATAQEARPYET
jgi:undecaprenyl-diphosphatase